MVHEQKLKRDPEVHIDFSEWEWGFPEGQCAGVFRPIMEKILAKQINVVFSQGGASAGWRLCPFGQEPGELMLEARIEVEEFAAAAKARFPLRDLILGAVDYWAMDGRSLEVAEALQALADEARKAAETAK